MKVVLDHNLSPRLVSRLTDVFDEAGVLVLR
jgi:predicted nuclease of predicted toxin-antitoxin system